LRAVGSNTAFVEQAERTAHGKTALQQVGQRSRDAGARRAIRLISATMLVVMRLSTSLPMVASQQALPRP
jgi:uncharacterized membrane protein